VGVAFTAPFPEGNDGEVKGQRFFICGKGKGLFVHPDKVTITPSFGEWQEAPKTKYLPKGTMIDT
jgi:dynactin complex subunit